MTRSHNLETNNISIFNLVAVDICEADYIHLIKCEIVTEPPLTERFDNDVITETIANQEIIPAELYLLLRNFFASLKLQNEYLKQ